MVRFEQIQDQEKQAEVFALRFNILCLEKQFYTAKPGQTQHQDRFDAASAHFAAYDNNHHVIAAGKLIFAKGTDHDLPVFAMAFHAPFDLDLDRAVEAASLVVDPRYRKSNLAIGLYRMMLAHCLSQKIVYCFAIQEARSLAKLTALGLPFQQMGPQIDHLGSPCMPCLLNLQEWVATMQQNNPPLYQWFQMDPHHLQPLP